MFMYKCVYTCLLRVVPQPYLGCEGCQLTSGYTDQDADNSGWQESNSAKKYVGHTKQLLGVV